MLDEFKITQSENMQDTPMLYLSGRMDAAAAQQLREECASILQQGKTRLPAGHNIGLVAENRQRLTR